MCSSCPYSFNEFAHFYLLKCFYLFIRAGIYESVHSSRTHNLDFARPRYQNYSPQIRISFSYAWVDFHNVLFFRCFLMLQLNWEFSFDAEFARGKVETLWNPLTVISRLLISQCCNIILLYSFKSLINNLEYYLCFTVYIVCIFLYLM